MKNLAALLIVSFIAQGAQAQRVNLNSSAFSFPAASHIRELAGGIPAPVSDVEKAGPRVTLLLGADESNRRDPVWPGYDVFGQPVLLYEAGVRSFLIAHPNPPAGYEPLFSGPRAVFVKPGPVPGLNFNFEFHFPVNGVDSFAYRYKPEGKPAQDARTLVHERFHVFQRNGFKPSKYAERTSEPDGEDLALAALEQKALKSALAAGSREAAAGYARQFLAARAARYTRFPDCQVQENREERYEGMARYTDLALMLRPEVSPEPGGMQAALSRWLDMLPDVDDMDKSRYYGTGAAQGLLLDRAGLADWKELVNSGYSPYELTLKAFPQTDAAAELARAKLEHGYDALLRDGLRKAADFQAAKSAAIAAYEALPGIEWSVPTAGRMGFSAASPQYTLPDGTTLLPEMYMIDAQMDGYRLNVNDRPAVLGGKAVRFHAQASVLLDGRPFPLADGVYSFGSLAVTEPGLDLAVSRPGTLTVTGRKAAVTLD